MGCFPLLKIEKKKSEHSVSIHRVFPKVQTPTMLPEPQVPTRSLQLATPSFRTRVKPVQTDTGDSSVRVRAYSAPESLDRAEQDALAPVEHNERDELKSRVGSTKEPRFVAPQPLPLPSPKDVAALKYATSFKSGNGCGPLSVSGTLPLPRCETHCGALKNFTFDEIASSCHNFSSDRCVSEGLSFTIYKASCFVNDNSSTKTLEASITQLQASNQGLKEFINEVNTLSSLRHPNLCKLLGYYARDGLEHRMLVYERLYHGSLDRILFGRSNGRPICWNARMKIALCAAQGLTFLHEEGPFQAMYNEFSTANIQIDKDFSAKLSGYGCVGHIPEVEISNSSSALGNLSVETLEKGLLTPKSNVWSFGIVLLELLTGRKNHNSCRPKDERNIVELSRPFLADDCRLSLIMDPRLKGRFPAKAARAVANIALRCLQTDPSERPTMRMVVEHLRITQDMRHSCRFPLQEPKAIAKKHVMSRSTSLNMIVGSAPRLKISPSLPSAAPAAVSPTRPPAFPLSLPPHSCSSTLSFVELERQESRKSSSSAVRRARVEGF